VLRGSLLKSLKPLKTLISPLKSLFKLLSLDLSTFRCYILKCILPLKTFSLSPLTPTSSKCYILKTISLNMSTTLILPTSRCYILKCPSPSLTSLKPPSSILDLVVIISIPLPYPSSLEVLIFKGKNIMNFF
jgi:hypothetical protein